MVRLPDWIKPGYAGFDHFFSELFTVRLHSGIISRAANMGITTPFLPAQRGVILSDLNNFGDGCIICLENAVSGIAQPGYSEPLWNKRNF